MSRPLRVTVPDGIFHVTARGNQRQPIVVDDVDRRRWLWLLDRTTTRTGWHVLTYCLLLNHFHLLVATPQDNLSRGMAQLNGSYAQAYNRRHERVGHLFQGRFGATLVQQDAHLLETFRYVALNPVRAGLCERAEDWRWSAHNALTGQVDAPGALAVAEALAWFGTSEPAARSTYARFVQDGAGASPVGPSGPWHGRGRILVLGERPTETPKRDWTKVRPSLAELLDGTRPDLGTAIARAHHLHGYTLAAIATQLGCHYSTVSRKLRAREATGGPDVAMQDLTPLAERGGQPPVWQCKT